jgi:hypothetical protein
MCRNILLFGEQLAMAKRPAKRRGVGMLQVDPTGMWKWVQPPGTIGHYAAKWGRLRVLDWPFGSVQAYNLDAHANANYNVVETYWIGLGNAPTKPPKTKPTKKEKAKTPITLFQIQGKAWIFARYVITPKDRTAGASTEYFNAQEKVQAIMKGNRPIVFKRI